MWSSKRSTREIISTKVVGGIGNQLFCYFAGYSLARKLDYQLVIDVSDIRQGRSKHGVSIESFNLPGLFVSPNERQFYIHLKRMVRYSRRVFPLELRLNSNYHSKVIGYDSRLDEINGPIKLSGYFQTFRYFEKVSYEILPLQLKTESEWFKSTLSELENSDFISIHIRRGDYEKLSQIYGLLDKSYYQRAIQKLEDLSINGRFVIFSDDIDRAREVLFGVVPENTYWINAPENVSPVESLVLMSHATANIIANSTYSWWGAALNAKNSAVIAPTKWFRNMDDPQDLYPPRWYLVESSWEL
jgi:hypothetical protein